MIFWDHRLPEWSIVYRRIEKLLIEGSMF